ncbi:hypothetical protein FISHEDRAFT_69803 [Fistulina hepatica ATCC 64428]|uniref:Uncharacterized protein n=1 Tax=Fistulina hepatica ATCC 64428 TaxID=1128425 RepID=A0A0D7AKJ0_9AGAR|nr:hypothetical protein FISHEDRAFT_69803 [Fistulina hepatica ATCC 64428]
MSASSNFSQKKPPMDKDANRITCVVVHVENNATTTQHISRFVHEITLTEPMTADDVCTLVRTLHTNSPAGRCAFPGCPYEQGKVPRAWMVLQLDDMDRAVTHFVADPACSYLISSVSSVLAALSRLRQKFSDGQRFWLFIHAPFHSPPLQPTASIPGVQSELSHSAGMITTTKRRGESGSQASADKRMRPQYPSHRIGERIVRYGENDRATKFSYENDYLLVDNLEGQCVVDWSDVIKCLHACSPLHGWKLLFSSPDSRAQTLLLHTILRYFDFALSADYDRIFGPLSISTSPLAGTPLPSKYLILDVDFAELSTSVKCDVISKDFACIVLKACKNFADRYEQFLDVNIQSFLSGSPSTSVGHLLERLFTVLKASRAHKLQGLKVLFMARNVDTAATWCIERDVIDPGNINTDVSPAMKIMHIFRSRIFFVVNKFPRLVDKVLVSSESPYIISALGTTMRLQDVTGLPHMHDLYFLTSDEISALLDWIRLRKHWTQDVTDQARKLIRRFALHHSCPCPPKSQTEVKDISLFRYDFSMECLQLLWDRTDLKSVEREYDGIDRFPKLKALQISSLRRRERALAGFVSRSDRVDLDILIRLLLNEETHVVASQSPCLFSIEDIPTAPLKDVDESDSHVMLYVLRLRPYAFIRWLVSLGLLVICPRCQQSQPNPADAKTVYSLPGNEAMRGRLERGISVYIGSPLGKLRSLDFSSVDDSLAQGIQDCLQDYYDKLMNPSPQTLRHCSESDLQTIVAFLFRAGLDACRTYAEMQAFVGQESDRRKSDSTRYLDVMVLSDSAIHVFELKNKNGDELYEALTGHAPTCNADVVELCKKIRHLELGVVDKWLWGTQDATQHTKAVAALEPPYSDLSLQNLRCFIYDKQGKRVGTQTIQQLWSDASNQGSNYAQLVSFGNLNDTRLTARYDRDNVKQKRIYQWTIMTLGGRAIVRIIPTSDGQLWRGNPWIVFDTPK